MTSFTPTPPFRRLALVLAALALLAAGGVRAASIGDLYEVLVPASPGGTDAAFHQGMADVLVRVTGRRDAPQLAPLAPLVAAAPRYVNSYRRVAGGRLSISFDGDAIEQAIASAGLPFWGEERPSTLVWLAVDRGGGQRGLVTAEATSTERRAVDLAAEQRGLPLVWPAAAGAAEARARFDQAWSGDVDSLAAAASQYGADGVLVGRAVAAGGGRYAVDWTFVGAGGRYQVRGDLGDGVDLAADRYAALFASVGGARRQQLVVTVTGVTTLMQYADATRLLAALPAARAVVLRGAGADALTFTVSARGGAEALRREAAEGGRLRPAGGAGDGLTLAYQP